MSRNLKSRLRRIRDTGKSGEFSGGHDRREGSSASERSDTSDTGSSRSDPFRFDGSSWPDWSEAGFKTLKREISRELSIPLPQAFPGALAILVPDLARAGRIPSHDELFFFDLETTGLSGGAGTVAFLAAFGRFAAPGEAPGKAGGGNAALTITQYLLLDYPGEADFIEKAAMEFDPLKGSGALPIVVSYNGKSFDSQILKNRCLMNGIPVPDYFQADLLHPSRRLWKRILPDCSQATVEVSVLGLDRAGDVSGALAPEIWFSFLKSGNNRELVSVCDHNVRDILGLASLFLALGEIAAAPLESRKKFRFDEEAMALSWRKAVKKSPFFFESGERKAAEILLKSAAESGYPRAAVAAAIDAEWRFKDPTLALKYTNAALANPEISGNLRQELEKRRSRLEGKTGLN